MYKGTALNVPTFFLFRVRTVIKCQSLDFQQSCLKTFYWSSNPKKKTLTFNLEKTMFSFPYPHFTVQVCLVAILELHWPTVGQANRTNSCPFLSPDWENSRNNCGDKRHRKQNYRHITHTLKNDILGYWTVFRGYSRLLIICDIEQCAIGKSFRLK